MKTLLITGWLAFACTGAAFAAPASDTGRRIAMGPDPGGHSGATVTPETTKTGNSTVDSVRESRSGGSTESVEKEKPSAQPQTQDKPASDTSAQSPAKK